MFRKIEKKNKVVLENESEEKIEVKSKVVIKKKPKWADLVQKKTVHTSEDIDFVIKQPEKTEENDDQFGLSEGISKVPQKVAPILFGEVFNENFKELAKNITHFGEIASSNPENSSAEELENSEMESIERDKEHYGYFDRDKYIEGKFTHNKSEITLDHLKKFIEEKISDIEVCKEMSQNRLKEITNLKESAKIILQGLLSENN